MGDNLVIVESPAKAKTIEKILGSDYVVKSSLGHICDLPKKGLGIDINNNFLPEYEISADKTAVVAELKKLSKKAKMVWLASDEDREGESIAWHLSKVLKLDEKSANRIVFHEITASAIKKAIAEPRALDINLVNAQQARRVLDRLVGFELSPLLWRKVRPSLSAGRVQSVAVKLIVEKEREIIAFKGKSFYKVTGEFSITKDGDTHIIKTELNKKFDSQEEAEMFLESCKGQQFTVGAVEKKPGRRSPSAPFTTSTLQQEASRKIGLSVSQTMRIAQKLYEEGYITYMRTDSFNLSKDAISAISSTVTGQWGSEYLKLRKYNTKSKGAQEAHEAIRPTYISKQTVSGTAQEKKLYELIWKRTVASQMEDAALEKTVINISSNNSQYSFVARGEVVVFDGFLKVYDTKGDDTLLPPLSVNDNMTPSIIEAVERFEQRPARYSEAALVKQMEELGIGRPSTYAPTISTVINRGYVIKDDREGQERKYTILSLKSNGDITQETKSEMFGSDKSKLFPTDIGMIVTDYLSKTFSSIMDYNFTASVENEFDEIADGGLQWQQMLAKFYGGFHSAVEAAGAQDTGYATPEQRLLGVDPVSGKNVYARMGKFGPMVQIGETDDDPKPKFAGLKGNILLETVTLEDALPMFALPRKCGSYEEKEITIGEGRFGPYIRHNSVFVSIPKDFDPLTISEAESIELIELKRKKDRERVMRVFDNDDKLQILNGRWGAYIFYDGGNYKVPAAKKELLTTMSYEEIMEIVKSSPAPAKKATKATKAKATSTKKSTSTAAKKTTTAKKATTKKSTTAKTTTAKKTTTARNKAVKAE